MHEFHALHGYHISLTYDNEYYYLQNEKEKEKEKEKEETVIDLTMANMDIPKREKRGIKRRSSEVIILDDESEEDSEEESEGEKGKEEGRDDEILPPPSKKRRLSIVSERGKRKEESSEEAMSILGSEKEDEGESEEESEEGEGEDDRGMPDLTENSISSSPNQLSDDVNRNRDINRKIVEGTVVAINVEEIEEVET